MDFVNINNWIHNFLHYVTREDRGVNKCKTVHYLEWRKVQNDKNCILLLYLTNLPHSCFILSKINYREIIKCFHKLIIIIWLKIQGKFFFLNHLMNIILKIEHGTQEKHFKVFFVKKNELLSLSSSPPFLQFRNARSSAAVILWMEIVFSKVGTACLKAHHVSIKFIIITPRPQMLNEWSRCVVLMSYL